MIISSSINKYDGATRGAGACAARAKSSNIQSSIPDLSG
ncbi:hypothetical protein D1AOALGA4SA_2244 [Olavius algarvensis Delta 1 endosymbiont]|nr:hypothetical protein D1AOALGA4SA_2244 [Olavius algarvensis Delta 1 endosymbiont]